MVPTNALTATLIYSDIFNFPLTEEEILKYFLYEKMNQKNLSSLLKNNNNIEYKNGFYFLKGKDHLVTLREKRRKISEKKLVTAQRVIHVLSFLPTIQLIGISGSVAVQNAKESDDIDLFIITQPGCLWTTRLLVNILLVIMGKKRKRGAIDAPNAICANMFMDESMLTLPQNKHNLYTAHEVVQMKSIFVRNKMDTIFIHENAWIHIFLPNIKIDSHDHHIKQSSSIMIFIETVGRVFQQLYMKGHMTTEVIKKKLLAFHPQDQQEVILKEFTNKLKAYEI